MRSNPVAEAEKKAHALDRAYNVLKMDMEAEASVCTYVLDVCIQGCIVGICTDRTYM
jgi:hypothetical protein